MKMLTPQPLFLSLAHHALDAPITANDMAHFDQLDPRSLGINELQTFQNAAENMLTILQAWQVLRRGEVLLPGIEAPLGWFDDFDFCRATIARIFENATTPGHPHFVTKTVTWFGIYGLLVQPKSETVIGAAYAQAFDAIRLEEKWGTCERCSGAFWTKSMKRRFCSESCKTLTSRTNKKTASS